MSATLEASPSEERRLMTAEEFDRLPERDDVDRWIIDGRLYEQPMVRLSYPHSGTEASIAYVLNLWLRQQTNLPGRVLSGEAGLCLRREPLSVPRAFGVGDELTAEPHLPGFRVAVAEIFA